MYECWAYDRRWRTVKKLGVPGRLYEKAVSNLHLCGAGASHDLLVTLMPVEEAIQWARFLWTPLMIEGEPALLAAAVTAMLKHTGGQQRKRLTRTWLGVNLLGDHLWVNTVQVRTSRIIEEPLELHGSLRIQPRGHRRKFFYVQNIPHANRIIRVLPSVVSEVRRIADLPGSPVAPVLEELHRAPPVQTRLVYREVEYDRGSNRSLRGKQPGGPASDPESAGAQEHVVRPWRPRRNLVWAQASRIIHRLPGLYGARGCPYTMGRPKKYMGGHVCRLILVHVVRSYVFGELRDPQWEDIAAFTGKLRRILGGTTEDLVPREFLEWFNVDTPEKLEAVATSKNRGGY